ncbi:hypothetical protein VPMS16_905 [Vibrio sp. 16]|nr:hypothetical protein VPMS16_905 [Vibrio sp. 16]
MKKSSKQWDTHSISTVKTLQKSVELRKKAAIINKNGAICRVLTPKTYLG